MFNKYSMGLFLFTPLALLLTVELINFKEITSLFSWIRSFPSVFFVEYFILILLFLGILKYNKVIFFVLSVTSSLILIFISFINKIKQEVRGDSLYPWDFFLVNETVGIIKSNIQFISVSNITLFLIIIIGVISLFILIYFSYNMIKSYSPKITPFISNAVLVVLIILFIANYNDSKLKNPIEKYDETGLLYGIFINSLYYFNMHGSSSDYNEEKINSIIKGTEIILADKKNEIKPNIIMIMSEAFWDIKKLEQDGKVKMNLDTLPFFRKLTEESITGELMVPVYGGATANTEFEVLTGLSTKFLVPGIIPYTTYIDKPIESLASVFSNQGYTSTAIHSYHNWFYNRNKVYRNLGFDKFISMEFFGNSKQIGAFLDDRDLFDKVLEEIKNTSAPNFIYAITMLNHGGYPENRFKDYKVQVGGDISPESKSILRTYAETQTLVDSSLNHLVDELKKLAEPTIVVFFGDHLPMLGDEFKVYKETGYYDSDNVGFVDESKMYTVPYLIWDNYSKKNNEKYDMSSNFLGGYLLNYAGFEGNVIFNHNNFLLEQGINFLPSTKYFDEVGINKSKMNLIQDYKLLQYDILFGNYYSKTLENLINPNYFLGIKQMKINSSNPNEIIRNQLFNEYNGDSIIGLMGEGFVEVSPYFEGGSEIYINGQRQKTIFTNENYISCIVPKEFYSTQGVLEVQVKVTDSKGNILSESNEIQIEIK